MPIWEPFFGIFTAHQSANKCCSVIYTIQSLKHDLSSRCFLMYKKHHRVVKLTHWGRYKITTTLQTTYWDDFYSNQLFFYYNFTEIRSQRIQWKYARICSDNDLTPIRQKCIIWNTDDLALLTRSWWVKGLRCDNVSSCISSVAWCESLLYLP